MNYIKNKYLILFILIASILLISVLSIFAFVNLDSENYQIIFKYRTFKVLTAISVGAGLSYSGLILQNYFANDLSSPYTLGLLSVSGIGVALSIILHLPQYMIFSLPLIIVLMYMFFLFKINNHSIIIFLGMFVNYLADSIIIWIKYLWANIEDYALIDFWFWGSLDKISLDNIWILAIIITSILLLFLKSNFFDILSQGYNLSKQLSKDIKQFKLDELITLTLVSLIIIFSTLASGKIGFLGLLAPHITKNIFPNNNYKNLSILAILIGINILLISNFIQIVFYNTIVSKLIPIGIILSIPGVIFMIHFIYKKYIKEIIL